ncbi:phage tail tape measure protein [Brevibacillus centrosporus]|uniref:phage tail tape measure protein n=1 Tax=Brevibacillus centrosporus TaxID=54910 RepID=UPI0039879623
MGVISNLMFAVGFRVSDRGLQDADNQVDDLKASVIGLGLAAYTALAGFGIAAVHAASQFEQAMSQVKMATDATDEQMIATREVAKELYNQNFGEDWSDLGNAIAVTTQITQQQGKELENTTRNALLLRDSFGHDVTESVKTADTMMKQFGITSENSFSLLAQGQQKGLDKSGELLDTANEYANQFKSLGFTADEMFDTLAAGSQNGAFNLDKVGDAVKEFNIRAKDGSKTSIEAFQMLGLDAEKMMQTFASGGPQAKQAFTQIMQMISAIEDPVQRNTVGVALMGTQFEDLEAPVIAAMGTAQKQFDMTKDTMEKLNKAKIDSPGQALALLGRQIETGLLIPLGQFLLPLLLAVSQGVGFFTQHIDILGPAIGGIAAVIIGAMVPAMWASAVAGWAMMAPFLPIIGLALLVGAAIAGVILIFKNWGTIGPWLSQVWTDFVNWTTNLFNSIVQFFSGINLFDIGKNLIQGMINGISSMATALMDKIKSIGDGITDKIKSILGIHSPSRVMAEIGFFTGEGLAQGIEGTQARVSQASTQLADDVTAPHETPAAKLAPASVSAAPGSASAGGTMRMEIALSLHVTGDADVKQVGASVAEKLKPTLQEIIESAARRLGVSLVVDEA